MRTTLTGTSSSHSHGHSHGRGLASRPLSLAGLGLVLLAGACNGLAGTEIELDVDRDTLPAGGSAFATITAVAYLDGDPVASGTAITFETTAGSLAESSSVSTISVPTDSQGSASVRLFSGPTPATATVTASFYDPASDQLATSSLSVMFVGP